MKNVASLRYGVIFKKAFCDPIVFKAFVKDMLNIEVEIDKVETEKSFEPIIGRVDSRFDLFAEDFKNRLVVDIQHNRYSDHYDRFLHYHCIAIIEQVKNAKDYRPDMRVYTIVILTSGDKHQKDVSISDFTPRDLQGNKVPEIEHLILFLCPKYVTAETPEPYRTWLRAIEDTLDEQVDETQYNNEIIQRVFRHIEKDSISPKERARMFDEYGEQELQREKFKEGIAEGEAKALLTVARQLLDLLDDETISQKTGLPLETIRGLRS